ncbi:MAG: RbsD or FucU transport [Chloroflexota bacterium]|jgi:L-fucose mutarotase
MLKSKLLHPEVLQVLGGSGHGGKVLIADGNYPFNTRANPAARRVYLNLAPGLLTVTDVLETLLTAIPVEAADVMITDSGAEPDIYADFRRLLPGLALTATERYQFYDKCLDRDVCLVIATGEQRLYANILLTIGVVNP